MCTAVRANANMCFIYFHEKEQNNLTYSLIYTCSTPRHISFSPVHIFLEFPNDKITSMQEEKQKMT